jgi:hypothetical protein
MNEPTRMKLIAALDVIALLFLAALVWREIFVGLVKQMIRGLVRMIDDPAQSTGLVVKVGDQGCKLCFGNGV